MHEPAAVLPPHSGTGALTPAQLNRARLRLAWEMLSQVGEQPTCSPSGAVVWARCHPRADAALVAAWEGEA